MENFNEYCKNYILDRIDDWEGCTHYGCEWADFLTEGPNADGSVTYSAYKAKQYLAEWWEDCAAYWQYEQDNFGKNYHNPFENPEAYMVCMLIEGVSAIMSRIDVIEEHWNEELEMTEEVIARIKECVAEISDDEELF